MKRDAYLDVIKGVAILAVVVGHSIQVGSGDEFMQERGYYYNDIFRFIYSWHMPLFMLVSGYLFSISVRRHDWQKIIISRFKQLVLPIFSWSFLITSILCTFGGDDGTFLYSFSKHFTNDIWFLWAIFYNSLLVLAVRILFADSIFVYLVLYVITFIVPDVLGIGLYKFMYPFFVSAYLYGTGKFPKMESVFSINRMLFLLLSLVVYIGLFSMYGYYAYIYTSGYAVVEFRTFMFIEWKFWNDIYRMLIGFVGSAVILLLIRLIYDNGRKMLVRLWDLLQNIGIASLAIYIISVYINRYVMAWLCKGFYFNYALTILESFLVVLVCYVGYVIISRYRIANKFLLGGR